MRISRLAGALAALAMLAAAGPAPAAALTVGLSDQHGETFADPLFASVGIRDARLVVPWDVVATNPALSDVWLGAARAAGVRPLVAFGRSAGSHCPNTPCVLPSVATYTSALRAFLARYPWVTQITPWNEGNDPGQPTWHDPRSAALLYNAAVAVCPSCTIVAADVLDNGTQTSWLNTYKLYASPMPSVWGLHNYIDVNYARTTGTTGVLAQVPGDVWITETAGLVHYVDASGVTTFPYDENRAAQATQSAFSLALAHADRIPRMYLYQWREGAAGTTTWDSGLVRANGVARPALAVVRQHVPAPSVATSGAALGGEAAGVAAAAPGGAAAPRPKLPLVAKLARRGGRIAVRLSCRSGGGRCAGVLRLYGTSRRVLRSAVFRVPGGGARTLTLAAPRRGRRVSVVARLTRPLALLLTLGDV